MSVMKPRTRMICVRLSEEEYAALRELCERMGARSVSDLTRDAMHHLLSTASTAHTKGESLDAFRMQLSHLDRKIEALAERMAAQAQGVQ